MTALQNGTRFSLPFPDGALSGLRWGGEGPPALVFLHANGFNAATYAPLLEPLGRLLPVVALDQRGHGLSTLPADPAAMREWTPYGRDLAAALDLLIPEGAPPAVLAGHSMGGVVSLFAAEARPRAVRRLLLLDPVLMHPLLRFAARVPGVLSRLRLQRLIDGAARRRAVFASKAEALATYRTRKTFMSWQPGFLEGYVEGGFVPDPEGVRLACAPAWEAANFAAVHHDAWRVLKAVEQPIHLMVPDGQSSLWGGPERARRLKPGLSAEVVPGTSHFFPMERPDRVAAALQGALANS